MASSIANQFKGLPMGDLIGGPLMAVCDAQVNMANATAEFIEKVGFIPKGDDAFGSVRRVKFEWEKQAEESTINTDGTYPTETVKLEVPLLAIVKVPSLSVEEANVSFDMEVKTAESHKDSTSKDAKFDASMSYGVGPFKAKVNISGSVSSSKENARSTDSSAKYHVDVKARDTGMPEGLARVMDMMNASIAPKSITKNGTAAASPAAAKTK